MILTFPVKVTSAVYKYLQVHLGPDYKLSETDHIGMYLYNLLRQPLQDKQYDKSVEKYTAKFPVRIVSSTVMNKRCKNCSSYTFYKFNTFIQNLLKAELHAYVDNHREFGLTMHGAIVEFMEKYDFCDEDYTFEALKKSYQRWKEDQAMKKNVHQICPALRPVAKLSLSA
ncbi:hypothetical protein [Pontibacter sp. SGAir0037]|uniref:hypothetical protein n=1 Tax=Pontibacter sp. SGAir0037 TaxID=2571030 RepID=UPI0010CD6A04|nr:hypothetical protein [Pontibacter sp. SGAir0037]QCR23091.1 hypothetical protein C1N53_12535 [Pontibacter sp. SGAir0037]